MTVRNPIHVYGSTEVPDLLNLLDRSCRNRERKGLRNLKVKIGTLRSSQEQ
jgi:hypothetical protein